MDKARLEEKRILTIDRTPMEGHSGRSYRVLGDDDLNRLGRGHTDQALLSIHSRANYPRDWHPGFGAFQAVEFDDVMDGRGALRKEEAYEIAALVDFWDGMGFRDYVIQCEAGISRSSAVCSSIATHFGDVGVSIVCHRRYRPNYLIEELLDKAFSEIGGSGGPQGEVRA